ARMIPRASILAQPNGVSITPSPPPPKVRKAKTAAPDALFVAQVAAGFGAERPPGPGKAEQQNQQDAKHTRQHDGTKKKDPLAAAHRSGDERIGGTRADAGGNHRRQQPDQPVFDQKGEREPPACGPEYLQHHGIIDPPMMPG